MADAPSSTTAETPPTTPPSQPSQPTPPAPTPQPPAPQPTPPAPSSGELGAGGVAALKAERDAREAAEKAARDAQAELDRIRRENQSEEEQLRQDAENGRRLAAEAVQTLRQANLLTALNASGLIGGKAKAAARLLASSVEFDDTTNEPKDLQRAIDAAKAEYGPELFDVGATPAPGGATPPVPGGPTPPAAPAATPQLHAGPRVPASAEEEDRMLAAYASEHFPQLGEAAQS